MSLVPNNLKYTKSHEWVLIQDNTATVGITDYAQEKLGDIVYVDLPELDKTVTQSEDLCVIESVKAASDIYIPIAGTICEINSELESNAQLVNESPYENGWIIKLKDIDSSEINNLMNAEDYTKFLKTI
jgi:glycine cleavage system H protein